MKTETRKTTFAFVISLFLASNILTGIDIAHAATPVISTSSNISNGEINPIILVNGNNFAQDANKFVFTLDLGTTGLTFDSVAFINSAKVRLNLLGTSRAGEISVQATKSTFIPLADNPSNTLTISVPDPLVQQTITIDALTPMTVTDSGQFITASSTSGLDVSFSSKTPNTCKVVAQKIQPIVAGLCSIKASQNGNTTYMAAPEIISTITISSAASGDVVQSVTNSTTVTSFAILEYFPDAPNAAFKDITISSSGSGQFGATKLKLRVPSQATKIPAVFGVSSYSTDSENDQGFFVAKVQLVDKSGSFMQKVEKVFEIYMPKGYLYTEIFWSSDGLAWQRIRETMTKSMPNDTHAAFFREVDGSVTILTDELGLFGYRFPQEDLKVISPAQTLTLNGKIQLSSSGGSGTGAVTFGTTTAGVCTVTTDGVVSAKQAGKCFVFVRKNAAQHYLDSMSTKMILSVQVSTPVVSNTQSTTPVASNKGRAIVGQTTCSFLSYSLTVLSDQVQANFCPTDAGKVAILYVRSVSSTKKWVDKEVARSVIDSNGTAVFDAALSVRIADCLHVFVNGENRL